MFKHRDHKHATVAEARKCDATEPLIEKVPRSLHQSPCVCGPYDRCWGVRVQDAKGMSNNDAIRTLFRAYND